MKQSSSSSVISVKSSAEILPRLGALALVLLLGCWPAVSAGAAGAGPRPDELILQPSADTGEHDLFGSSAAISGNTMIIGGVGADGAVTDTGAAYIFERSGNGWVQTATLLANDGNTFDDFGSNVAISGDTAIVAAEGHTHPGSFRRGGAVFVFQRINGTWVQQVELRSPTPANSGLFGNWGIAISGNMIVVGDAGNRLNLPAVDVFALIQGAWQHTATLMVPDDENFAPNSVAIDHNTVVAGSSSEFPVSTAYVFQLVDGVWVEQAKLTAADDNFFNSFGFNVSMSDDVIAVSANFGTGGSPVSGAVYIFGREGESWNLEAKLIASDGADFDDFGFTTSVTGGKVLIGAPEHATAAGFGAGSAYLYQKRDGAWSQIAELSASDAIAGGSFGISVAVQDNAMLIGASGQHPPVEGYPGGEAYVDRLSEKQN
jgi:hypothetical protein